MTALWNTTSAASAGAWRGQDQQLLVQVAGDQQRRILPGDGHGLAQPLTPELLLRPDERLQPGDVVGIAHVQRVQVDPGPPHHRRERRGKGTAPLMAHLRTGGAAAAAVRGRGPEPAA